MIHISTAMEAVGFLVPDRQTSDVIYKAVGYALKQDIGRVQLPADKLYPLYDALAMSARQARLDVEILSRMVGLYMFGAQLRRELMSVPHACYKMISDLETGQHKNWKTVQNELAVMSGLLPLCFHALNWPASKVLWAADAMGASERDCGGFGVVCSPASSYELGEVLANSHVFGRTIAQLDGRLSGLKDPSKEIHPTIPFCLIPSQITDQSRWVPVSAGRWKYRDHITLGEARGVRKVGEILLSCTAAHALTHVVLQDNQAAAGGLTKGRSPSWALNFICRRKAAASLAGYLRLILPWMETSRMPADILSRS
jgi:hypothetical protein